MVMTGTLGGRIVAWAAAEPSVRALVMIGSRVRAEGPLAADAHSDWDFQIVTDRSEIFLHRDWMTALGGGEPLAYVVRLGRLGSAIKVTAVSHFGELDLVVISAARLKLAKLLVVTGMAPHLSGVRSALGHLALVVRPGHRLLKGEAEWGAFFRRLADEFPSPRLGDADVRTLAEGFVCDYVSTTHKIERGEFLAAQRWLHHHLAEVNFQLLHELRQRRGEASLPDARRIEKLPGDWRGVEVSAAPAADSLRLAADKSAATLRELMAVLVPAWRWPDLK